MFSGFSSYLGFNPQGSESVQALLQKTDLCLDELLDDEGLLTELKTQNDDLLAFLKADENYTKMLNHVILEPSAEEQQLNPQKCFKFPLVSADVLSSECTPLVLYLLNCNESDSESGSEAGEQGESPSTQKNANENSENPKYIDYLFTLLDNKELNYTAAGYFAKIMTNLYEKHSSEFLAYIYKKRPETLEKLVNHISSESISELLLKILSFEVNMVDGPNDETYTVKRAQTLQSLTQKLDGEKNPELANGAAYIVSEVIDKATSIHKGDEIIAGLQETAPIEELYKILKTKNPTSVVAVTTVLGKMFAHNIVMALETDEEDDDNFGTQEDPKLSSDIPLVAVTTQNIQTIVSIIAEAQEGKAAFGSFRMKLIDLMGSILEGNNVDMNAKVIESEFFKIVMSLFFKFEWHNILHNRLEVLINEIVISQYENLKVSLFENAQILNTIIEAFNVTEIQISGKKTEKKIRRGYLGQLVKIANKIRDSEDPVVMKYLENNTAWEEFVVVELDEVNKKNKIKLGGVNPKFERCGSFEVQHWSTMSCMQTSKIPLDSEEQQQNDQEGLPEIEKIKLEEGMPPTISLGEESEGPKLSKFSQVGAAEKLIRRRSSRDQSAELEIYAASQLVRRKSSKDQSDMEIPEEGDQILTTKTLHMKFSQLGAAGKLAKRRSSRDGPADEEIAEEVVETASPMLPGGLKFFKFEEIIDESIEENIQAEQEAADEPSKPLKGLKIPMKFM